MRNTSKIGNHTEAVILTRLLEASYHVALPFGSGARYDMIAERNDQLLRVQCKTGRVRDGCVLFNSASVTHTEGGIATISYYGKADVFAVYVHDTDDVYLVPVAEAPSTRCTLRLRPTENLQEKRVRWAEKYRLRAA